MTGKKNWDWVPEHMPGVAQLMAEKRKIMGNAHVNECWRQGVLNAQPGWFFAREGTVTVGAPWDAPELVNFAAASVTSTQALLILRSPEVTDGAH